MTSGRWRTLYPHDGRAFRLKAGCANITIHRWNERHGWWLTAIEAHYDAHLLNTEDLEEAKRLAVQMVLARLKQAVEALEKESEEA